MKLVTVSSLTGTEAKHGLCRPQCAFEVSYWLLKQQATRSGHISKNLTGKKSHHVPYNLTHLIVEYKKAHAITEDLVIPTAIDIKRELLCTNSDLQWHHREANTGYFEGHKALDSNTH